MIFQKGAEINICVQFVTKKFHFEDSSPKGLGTKLDNGRGSPEASPLVAQKAV